MELYNMFLNKYIPLLDTTKRFKVIQGINTEGRPTEDIYIRAEEEDGSTVVTVHMGAGIYKDEVFNNMKGYLFQFLKEELSDAPDEWIDALAKI